MGTQKSSTTTSMDTETLNKAGSQKRMLCGSLRAQPTKNQA
jgi:hypothetical protein